MNFGYIGNNHAPVEREKVVSHHDCLQRLSFAEAEGMLSEDELGFESVANLSTVQRRKVSSDLLFAKICNTYRDRPVCTQCLEHNRPCDWPEQLKRYVLIDRQSSPRD